MNKVKICIDAGHYGKYNQSPANKNYYESEMTWKLHLLQKKYLEEYGAEVVLTREDQKKDLALVERGQMAKGCDLFISDHSNAVGSKVNESVDYVAVYHLLDDAKTKCDDVSKEIAKKLAPVIAKIMGTSQGSQMFSRKSEDDRNGDGIMNDNYYGVLHGARTVEAPALILEHSFHTNTKMTNWLMVDENLDRLAKAEADAIAEYFGLSKAKTMYKVQVGAFENKANADKLLAELKSKGFNGFIVKQEIASEKAPTPIPTHSIAVGSTVRLKQGAKTYSGSNLASFVYNRDHKVSQIKGDRVVITYGGNVVAAVKLGDLILV